LGKRADLTSLKIKRNVLEAHFEISKYNLSPFFESNELDYEEETIRRNSSFRKIQGFINDSP
jgi:DNA repair protein RecN (Recombination protein N)